MTEKSLAWNCKACSFVRTSITLSGILGKKCKVQSEVASQFEFETLLIESTMTKTRACHGTIRHDLLQELQSHSPEF